MNVAKSGNREHALARITEMYKKASAGVDDFTAMCSTENDDPSLAKTKGDIGTREPGSLPPPYDKLEAEIWKLQAGQITHPIDTGAAFYLAKVEEVRPGVVRPFNEQPNGERASVQEEIKSKLQKEQFRELNQEMDTRLRKSAYIRTDEVMMTLCVEMAMQRYAAVAQN